MPRRAQAVNGAQIVYDFGNGETVAFLVSVDAAYPEAVAVARVNCSEMFREEMAYIRALESTDATEETP